MKPGGIWQEESIGTSKVKIVVKAILAWETKVYRGG